MKLSIKYFLVLRKFTLLFICLQNFKEYILSTIFVKNAPSSDRISICVDMFTKYVTDDTTVCIL